jgi:hypothetical protein
VVRSNINLRYLFVQMLVNNKQFITLLNSSFGDMVQLCFLSVQCLLFLSDKRNYKNLVYEFLFDTTTCFGCLLQPP